MLRKCSDPSSGKIFQLRLGLIGVAHTSAFRMAPDFTPQSIGKITFEHSSPTQSRELMVFGMLAMVPLIFLSESRQN